MAALALIWHGVIVSLADGATADASARDAFGNVICATVGKPDTPALPGRHSATPDCCLAGCSVASGPAPSAPAINLPVRPALLLAAVLPAYRGPAKRSERSPLNPRAPPPA